MICKGFMKPEDICMVDMNGKQLAGKRKRSSEVLLHLAIMKARPDVKSVVHCHPPHATAFAVAREPIPQCVLPEVEVFLGDVPITKYETPGGQDFADTVLPFVHKTNVIILANHGTVSYGENVEQAYWWTEILDAYCRILMLARELGRVNYLDEQKTRELLDLKTQMGLDRPAADTGHGELRHLRQRHLPRQLEGRGRRAARRSTPPPPMRRPKRETALPASNGSRGADSDDHRARDGRPLRTE